MRILYWMHVENNNYDQLLSHISIALFWKKTILINLGSIKFLLLGIKIILSMQLFDEDISFFFIVLLVFVNYLDYIYIYI